MIGRHRLEAGANQPFLSKEFTEALRGTKQLKPIKLEEFWGEVDDKQWQLNERFLSNILGRPERQRSH